MDAPISQVKHVVYVFIGLVLLLIIGPIIAVLPSPRQKEQMDLRHLAKGLGINIELTSITDPVPKQDKYISSLGKSLEPILKVIAYRKARKMPEEWRRATIVNWAIERRLESVDDDLPGNWCWVEGGPATLPMEFFTQLGAALAVLPDDVERVDEMNRVLSVYWHERGDAVAVRCIDQFLDSCAALLNAPPGVGSDDQEDHS